MPESPVFILGHWRIVTTLLHNLLCQDKQFSYVTTYQGVFVNVFFSGRWFFRPIMKALMPDRRATDNVKLAAGLPQEEGFALANMGSFAFYTYWYFPKLWRTFYKKYVRCEHVSKTDILYYRKQYRKLIAQSIRFHGRKGFVSKNPPNTGRINELLEMFPNARFIYIYRNPMMVFQSTVHFFTDTMAALQMQKISKEELEELVFGCYQSLIQDYEQQKSLIPEGHLVEIRYEDFVKDPLPAIESIYTQLDLSSYADALPAFQTYLESQQKFHRTKRQFTEDEKVRVKQRLAFAFDLYGYK
jgi:hypothetical protein